MKGKVGVQHAALFYRDVCEKDGAFWKIVGM